MLAPPRLLVGMLLVGIVAIWARTHGMPAAHGQPAPVACAELDPTPTSIQVADGTDGGYVEPGASGQAVQADAATASAMELLVRTLAACLSDGESERVAMLATERYLGVLAGGGPPMTSADYVALAAELPVVPVTVQRVGDVRIEAAGQATADVIYVLSHQLIHARWRFVHELTESTAGTPPPGSAFGRWLVDAEMLLPVETPPEASVVPVELDEYDFSLAGEVQGPTVVLQGTNVGNEDHELLVVRLRGVATLDDLLRHPGPGLPDGADFVGQITAPAGEEVNLTLVDLSPGRYALVCLLPDAEGIPHLSLGMGVELTVE